MADMSQWYIRLGNWGFNLILLNILWILFSVSGLLVLGFFPATAAMFAVLKHMIMEDEDTAIVKLFIHKFKSEFLMSNAVGYPVAAFGLILYMDVRVLQQLDSGYLQLILASMTVVIGIIYLLTLLYIFPIFVHFDIKLLQYPLYAVILAVAKPFHTILLLSVLAIVVYVYFIIPALIFVFGFSLIGYIMTRIASASFPRKEAELGESF
jgi:uncharacterized membrane protein YesL